jgi:hypothetical protein
MYKMRKIFQRFDDVYALFLSERTKSRFEKVIFLMAIVAYILHFTLIFLVNNGLLLPATAGIDRNTSLLSAINTPFSIILIYEIYLLIFYLPASITSYLGHQYEVVALIFLRKLFDDLSVLAGSESHMIGSGELKSLSISFAGLIILLLLIFLFYFINGKNRTRKEVFESCTKKEKAFVVSKKIMALGLIAFFVLLFIHSVLSLKHIEMSVISIVHGINYTSKVFFSNFFVMLIISEVLLLMFTFNLTDRFSKIIRNSGFIVSTILLKISFMTEGVYNIITINIAVAFGVAMLAIHQLYKRKLQ